MTSEITNIPTHVSIIMDGNGRWACSKGHDRLFGHNAGVESVKTVVEYAREKGIRYLSLFAFSEENWGRPDDEVSGLMDLMTKAVLNERQTFAKYEIRLRIVGNREQLPDDLVALVEEVEAETISNSSLDLIIMLSYSGRWDILEDLILLTAVGAIGWIMLLIRWAMSMVLVWELRLEFYIKDAIAKRKNRNFAV
jgi:undecaprenyl diphosphate synthase